jgi:polysaccharide chain length determinant protein (PEP-CTERM system associated)
MDEVIRQVLDVLRGMWHRRWIGVIAAWVAAVIGAVVLAKIPDRYEATARVYVDTSSLLKPLLSGLAIQPDIDQQVGMLARTLITRPNIEKLIGKTDLDAGLAGQAAKDKLIDTLMKELRFSTTGRDNVYNVSFRDSDRAHAQRVVQALVSMFVESGLGNKRRDTETTRKFIDEQIARYEKQLQEAENRLKEFRLRNLTLTTSGGGAGGQDYVARTAAATDELAKAKLELRVAEQSRDALKRELAGEEPILLPDSSAQGPQVGGTPELDARIDAQKRLLDELLRRYTDQHPDVAQTRRMIASLEEQKREEMEARRKAAAARGPGKISPATNPVFQQIKISLTEAEANVAALQARVTEMQSRFDQLRASANRVPQVEAELAQLNRDYDVIRQSYQQMVARRESATLTGEVDESAGLAEFRIIDPPRVGDKPVFPNRMMMVPLLLVVALGVGAGAAFVASQLMPTIHSTRTLRELGQRPVLGSLSLRPNAALVKRQRISTMGFAGSIAGLVVLYGSWLAWLALVARS